MLSLGPKHISLAGADIYRTLRGDNPPVEPTPLALVLDGVPEALDVDETSDPITVRLSRPDTGTYIVALTLTGVDGVLSESSVTVSSALEPTFTMTATESGTATITATATGLPIMTATLEVYEGAVESWALDNWFADVDPNNNFGSPGNIPAGAGFGSGGYQNQFRAHSEFDYAVNDGPASISTWSGVPTTPSAPGNTGITTTEVQRGWVTATNPYCRIITADGHKAYEFIHKRSEIGYTDGGTKKKCRAELKVHKSTTVLQHQTPWGQECWLATSMWFHPDMADLAAGAMIVLEWHDNNSGGLSKGGGANIRFICNGAGNARLEGNVEHYGTINNTGTTGNGTGWLSGQPKPDPRTVSNAVIANSLEFSVWYTILINYRMHCQYSDPELGDIYGPPATGPNSRGFVRMYVQKGAGALQQKLNYQGFWHSPHNPFPPSVPTDPPLSQYRNPSTHMVTVNNADDPGPVTRALCDGYWKTGPYAGSGYTMPIGDTTYQLIMRSRGFRLIRSLDNLHPTLNVKPTASTVLADWQNRRTPA